MVGARRVKARWSTPGFRRDPNAVDLKEIVVLRALGVNRDRP